MPGWLVGLAILIVTLLHPNIAGAGLIAVTAAYGFARLIRMDPAFLDSGFYTYNPLLVGLSVGYLFKLTALTVFFTIAAGILAFVLTHVLYSLFATYLRLPVLSLPFVLVSTMAYLAASQYANLFVTGLYPHYSAALELPAPVWLAGFLKSLGAVFFIPHTTAGLVFALLLLLSSRILFLLAAGGYYAGTLSLAWLVGSYPQAFGDFNGFNFILIAMAIGGVFMIPAPRTYLLTLIAVAASTLPLSAAEGVAAQYGLPVFALPFNLVTLTFVYLLGVVGYPYVAYAIKRTPEVTLDYYLTNLRRYPGTLRTLGLPFSGAWTVWQGFDGQWTHQGAWRHACDFTITGEDGSPFRGDGARLEDYFAFRKPVLSPVRGRVAKVVDHLPDNPIGETDRTNNWGNLVVIRDERGFFVELSHFAQASIRVEEGNWVERGALLGLCGNSGYSPQPHIHVQVQAQADVGAATMPFSFVGYTDGARFHANDIPQEGDRVEPLFPDKRLDGRMAFILDDTYRFAVYRGDRRRADVEMTVRMAPDGTFFFDTGRARLYFGRSEGTFYAYRLEGRDAALRALFLALPRLPPAYREGLQWSDHLPVDLAPKRWRRGLVRLLRSFHHGAALLTTTLTFTAPDRIDGTVTSSGLIAYTTETRVTLDPVRGFRTVEAGPVRLERLHDESIAPDRGGAAR